MTLRIESIDDSFACEVKGLDLWAPLGAATAEALRRAFTDHPLLVFRRQALEESELMAFASVVGEPSPYAESGWQSQFREIVLLSNMRDAVGEQIGGLANQELAWHTDQSFYAVPVTGSILYAAIVPPHGGRTSWADLYGAYEALPVDVRKIVDGAVATFSYASRARYNEYRGDNVSRAERIRTTPDVKHRLVHTHARTGRKALYIDPRTVTGIDDMPDDEAHDVLDELLRYAVRPGNVYHHDWRAGDLMLWGNAVLLHRRDAFPETGNRLVKRMIIRLPEGPHIIPPSITPAAATRRAS